VSSFEEEMQYSRIARNYTEMKSRRKILKMGGFNKKKR
jgi:hypothetical protein